MYFGNDQWETWQANNLTQKVKEFYRTYKNMKVELKVQEDNISMNYRWAMGIEMK